MSLIVRRCLSRSRLLEELVEIWQIDHDRAMIARDVEELIQECLALNALWADAWKWVKNEAISTGPIGDEHMGKMAQMACKKR